MSAKKKPARLASKSELVDVSGTVYKVTLLGDRELYPAFRALPPNFKIDAAYAKAIEQYRVEPPARGDEQALGPGTAIRKIGQAYSRDGREIRSYERHVQWKMRLAAQATSSCRAGSARLHRREGRPRSR